MTESKSIISGRSFYQTDFERTSSKLGRSSEYNLSLVELATAMDIRYTLFKGKRKKLFSGMTFRCTFSH